MPLTIISKFNYLVKLMLILAAILILILAVFLLVNSYPESLGAPPPDYQIEKSYEFEPWAFSFHNLSISFPEGGIIVPIYEEKKQKAALILGREICENKTGLKNPEMYDDDEPLGTVKTPESSPEDIPIEPAGIFLMITEEELETIKGEIIFIPVEEAETGNTEEPSLHVANINDIFCRQPGLPVIWPNKIPFIFSPSKSAGYYYLIDRQGNPVLPPVLNQTSRLVYISGLLYVLFYFIIWLTVLALSLGHCSSRWKKRQAPSRWELGAMFLAGAAAFGGEVLPGMGDFPEILLSAGYGAAALLLFASFKTGKINCLELGIDGSTCGQGYLIAVMAAVMLLTTTLKLPQGIRLPGRQTATMFITIFFCLGLSREAIWRGFIQNILGRLLGPAGGLLLTALLAGAIRAGVYFVTAPWMLSYPFTYVEIAVLEPGLAAILGFLYLRTGNILSCALLHTLVIFLPQILVF